MGLDDIIGIGGKLLDKLIPDPAQKDAAKLKLLELAQQGDLAQLNADLQLATNQTDINKIEAGSNNLFVAGWRPAVGWVCVAGLGYQLVLNPLLTGLLPLAIGHPVAFPDLDFNTLMTILGGILGIGTMRTYERVKGVIPNGKS